MTNRFEVGELVYVIYRIKNSRGVNKWHVSDTKREILGICEKYKKPKYLFKKYPKRVGFCEVFLNYEEAKKQCNEWNHWEKYHKTNGYKATHKKNSNNVINKTWEENDNEL